MKNRPGNMKDEGRESIVEAVEIYFRRGRDRRDWRWRRFHHDLGQHWCCQKRG